MPIVLRVDGSAACSLPIEGGGTGSTVVRAGDKLLLCIKKYGRKFSIYNFLMVGALSLRPSIEGAPVSSGQK